MDGIAPVVDPSSSPIFSTLRIRSTALRAPGAAVWRSPHVLRALNGNRAHETSPSSSSSQAVQNFNSSVNRSIVRRITEAEMAVRNGLLIIPGAVFSRRDSHFRLSYAADDATIDRGVEVLNRLARR